MPPLTLVLSTLVGGTLLAVSANVMNQVFEIERDKLMQRTADRPLVTGELTKSTGIGFSIITGIIGFATLCVVGAVVITVSSSGNIIRSRTEHQFGTV